MFFAVRQQQFSRFSDGMFLVRFPLLIADTHGSRIAGPRPDGNPGGRNTGRNPRYSGMCDHNRHLQPDTRLHLNNTDTTQTQTLLPHSRGEVEKSKSNLPKQLSLYMLNKDNIVHVCVDVFGVKLEVSQIQQK